MILTVKYESFHAYKKYYSPFNPLAPRNFAKK